jgi:AcrR family transcriptional regulator
MSDTRIQLLNGALETLRTKGLVGTSARSIAAAAGANQALIFYHFGSVDGLLTAACAHGAQEQVERYAERFATVTSLSGLLDLGLELHEQGRTEGNVDLLAQLLAGAQSDPKLASATADALNLWIIEIETVLRRVLATSPIADVLNIPGLAGAIAAAFIGIELYEGVDHPGASRAIAAISQLGALVELIDDLPTITRRVLRAKLRRAAARSRPTEAPKP